MPISGAANSHTSAEIITQKPPLRAKRCFDALANAPRIARRRNSGPQRWSRRCRSPAPADRQSVSIFTAAAKAAITVGPKLFTSPCTMRMPKFITDCCAAGQGGQIADLPQHGPVKVQLLLFRAAANRQHRQTYSRNADCRRHTAPERWRPPPRRCPSPKPPRTAESSPMFSSADTARNTSGTAELPKARSRQAQKL